MGTKQSLESKDQIDEMIKKIPSTTKFESISEQDRINLFLNISAFSGKNIFRIKQSLSVHPYDNKLHNLSLVCVTVPAGVWFYKVHNSQVSTKNWYSSLEGAKWYVDKFPNKDVTAVQVLEPLTLMILNEKKNIKNMLSDEFKDKYTELQKREIQAATGVDTSIFIQMDMYQKEFGFLNAIKDVSLKALIWPQRAQIRNKDEVIMEVFCKIWEAFYFDEEHQPTIDGYLATFLDSSFNGSIPEEILLCYKTTSNLSSPITLSKESVDNLIKRHSILSATWYTHFRKTLKTHYKTLAILTLLSFVLKKYKQRQVMELQKKIDTNWKSLEKTCLNETQMSSNELVQLILFQTAFSVPAIFLYDGLKNQIKTQTEICEELNKYQKSKQNWQTFTNISGWLAAMSAVYSPSFIAQLFKFIVLPYVDSKKNAINKEYEKIQILEEKKFPNLNELPKWNQDILDSIFEKNQETMTEFQIRQRLLHFYPNLYAFVFFDSNGHLRSKTDTLIVASFALL